MKANYRILNTDGTYLNAGTGNDSWFFMREALDIVNESIGQIVVEHNGISVVCEIVKD
jgi:hypothetical protein